MQTNKQKVPARHLLNGDRLSSGETIVAVSRGARTPPGRAFIFRDGLYRMLHSKFLCRPEQRKKYVPPPQNFADSKAAKRRMFA